TTSAGWRATRRGTWNTTAASRATPMQTPSAPTTSCTTCSGSTTATTRNTTGTPSVTGRRCPSCTRRCASRWRPTGRACGAGGALWGFNFGAGAPTASLWLRDHGWDYTTIGQNTAAYYLGIALTAPLVPGMMRRRGRGCILLGMICAGFTVALFPWGGGLI